MNIYTLIYTNVTDGHMWDAFSCKVANVFGKRLIQSNYAISCSKCGAQYIGETEKTLQKRFSQHLGYVRNDHQNKATGQHFNLPGHSLDNTRVSVIETINNKSEFYRKNREKYFIEKFNTRYKGLNRNQKRWYFANCNCF